MEQFYLTDLDKTFLRDDLKISDYSREVWNKLVDNGIKLSIATARSLTGVRELLTDLRLEEPMIILDGAVISTIDGKILDVQYLNRDISNEIIEFSYKNLNAYPIIVGLDDSGDERFLCSKEKNIYQKELLSRFNSSGRVINESENIEAVDKNLKIVYLNTKKATAKLVHALKSKFGESIEIKRVKDPYMNCYFLTILHPKGDKANALKRLEKIKGIDRKYTTVFGDSYNDIELFKVAGRKIAIANAIDELKSLADITLPWSNQEDGVMRFLDKELLTV